MNSRERTFLALEHQEPDRVPIDFWSTKGFDSKLKRALKLSREEWLDKYDVDLRYIKGPEYIGPEPGMLEGGVLKDIFGVGRREVTVKLADGCENYKELAHSPLATAETVDQIEQYDHWPKADWFDYSGIEAQCEAIRRAKRVAVFMGDRVNRIAQLKPAMYVRGVEQIFLDLALNPDIARTIFKRIRKFYLDYAERILTAAKGKIDIVLTGDDFGSQNGALMSPSMWTSLLADGFGAYVDMAHSLGAKVMHHTCGSVGPIIPLMVEQGLDILQSLQPEASDMDHGKIKKSFGERLCFQGGISIQQVMPYGSTNDVTAAVKKAVKELAEGGGYIFGTAHNLQADVPVANARALLESYHRYGRY